jgi:UDP-N-acetylglucosamine diphosphorylase/glucosamine-1-phosphate N-acetyltransferase
MKNLILFDDEHWSSLLPLSYTKPVAALRVGILTIKEKWEKRLDGEASYITQDYLSTKFPIKIADDNIVISGSLLPNDKIVHLIKRLNNNEAILYNDTLIAARIDRKQFELLAGDQNISQLAGIDISDEDDLVRRIQRPHDIFMANAEAIEEDFLLLSKGRDSATLNDTVRYSGLDNIFIEAGAKINHAILNATTGPIYIGKDAEIMEGSVIRGPFAMCENSVVKMAAKIYGGTTLGPYCKVGGELNNVVIQGYSSKAHDGFLGNAVLGEWCNLGADTNNSNLKNNYAPVKLYDYTTERFEPTGLQFCGLIMGDHSKCGINTMLNTGTVVGVSANLFGSGFPRNFVPSFSWGGNSGYTTYKLEKQLEVAEIVMARRNLSLDEEDRKILGHVFHASAKYRTWES